MAKAQKRLLNAKKNCLYVLVPYSNWNTNDEWEFFKKEVKPIKKSGGLKILL